MVKLRGFFLLVSSGRSDSTLSQWLVAIIPDRTEH